MKQKLTRVALSAAIGVAIAISGAGCSNDTTTDAPQPQSSTAASSSAVTPSTQAGEASHDRGGTAAKTPTATTPKHTEKVPPPQTKPASTTQRETPRCTDRQSYAGDPRSNAEINSLGESTGKCPTPIKSGSPTN